MYRIIRSRIRAHPMNSKRIMSQIGKVFAVGTVRVLRHSLVLAACILGFRQVSMGQEAPSTAAPVALASGTATLFQNVRIFDGKSPELSAPSNVLVTGNKIERISVNPIATDGHATVRVIAGNGRALIPGLIDAHWHAFMAATTQQLLMTADASYLNLLAARQAEATLMRGFTTVRDLGGPVFGLKRTIDEGVMVGPRIYPSALSSRKPRDMGIFDFLLKYRERLVVRSATPRLRASRLLQTAPTRSGCEQESSCGMARVKSSSWPAEESPPVQSNRIDPVHRTGDSCGG